MNIQMSTWSLSLLLASSTLLLTDARASTYTVTSTASGGICTVDSTSDPACTLDAAIAAAANADAIHFSAAVQTQTITGGYTLNHSVTIDAGPGGVVLDGGGVVRVFSVSDGLTIALSHLTLQNGKGDNSGGAIYNTSSDVSIDSCTLANNSATQFGGAIENATGNITIINSTIANNTAAAGGGIFSSGSAIISNSTITGNSAPTNGGGGIANTGTLTLLSNIIAANTNPTTPEIWNSDVLTSLGYNLIGDGTGADFPAQSSDQVGTSAIKIDPEFVAAGLADNGGPTSTIALQSNSPASSAGNCTGNAGSPTIASATLDQRGVVRGMPCTSGAFDLTSIFSNGFEAAGISIQALDLDFGFAACGASAAPRSLAIENGGSTVRFTASLTSGASYYTLSVGSSTIAPGNTFVLGISANAIPASSLTTSDLYAGQLTITTDIPGDSEHVIALHETAQGARLAVDTTALDFGGVPVGQTAQAQFMTTNSGNASATVFHAGYATPPFTVSPTSMLVPGGGSMVSTVAFAPQQSGAATGQTVATTTTDGLCLPLPAAISLSGTGTP